MRRTLRVVAIGYVSASLAWLGLWLVAGAIGAEDAGIGLELAFAGVAIALGAAVAWAAS